MQVSYNSCCALGLAGFSILNANSAIPKVLLPSLVLCVVLCVGLVPLPYHPQCLPCMHVCVWSSSKHLLTPHPKSHSHIAHRTSHIAIEDLKTIETSFQGLPIFHALCFRRVDFATQVLTSHSLYNPSQLRLILTTTLFCCFLLLCVRCAFCLFALFLFVAVLLASCFLLLASCFLLLASCLFLVPCSLLLWSTHTHSYPPFSFAAFPSIALHFLHTNQLTQKPILQHRSPRSRPRPPDKLHAGAAHQNALPPLLPRTTASLRVVVAALRRPPPALCGHFCDVILARAPSDRRGRVFLHMGPL